jgi:hypothetical protein
MQGHVDDPLVLIIEFALLPARIAVALAARTMSVTHQLMSGLLDGGPHDERGPLG